MSAPPCALREGRAALAGAVAPRAWGSGAADSGPKVDGAGMNGNRLEIRRSIDAFVSSVKCAQSAQRLRLMARIEGPPKRGSVPRPGEQKATRQVASADTSAVEAIAQPSLRSAPASNSIGPAPTSGRNRGRGPPQGAGIPFTAPAMAPCRLVMMARVRSRTAPTRPRVSAGSAGRREDGPPVAGTR